MRELLLLFLNQEFTKGPPVPLALEGPEGYKHPQPAAQSGGFPLKKRDCQEGRKPVGESRGMHVESPKKGQSSSLIPAESGTKTSKIRKLLLLGLTHREIADLIKKDKLVNGHKSLKDLILEMEDEVLAGAGVDVFEEVFKLIFTKLFDEMESGRKPDRNR